VRRIATVLYEDQGVPNRKFGPHEFVLACVFDRADGERYKLSGAFDGIPKKGNLQVRTALRDEFEILARDGRHVFALFDSDQVRRLIGIPGSSSLDEVRTQILSGHPDPTRAHVHFLDRNLESVLRGLEECRFSHPRLHDALDKDLNARDLVLLEASKDSHRETRRCVLDRLRGLLAMVDHLVSLALQNVAGTRDSRND
jgi:hypothetical protein